MDLDERAVVLEETLDELYDQLEAGGADIDVDSIGEEIDQVKKDRARTAVLSQKKKDSLNVKDREDWKCLQNNQFLAKRISTLALKQRVRDRLQMRRFEIDALKRHESKQKKDSHKLTQNAKAHINRREPTIKKLVIKYNKQVQELKDMIAGRKGVPLGGVAPLVINLDEIWDLDVDSDIWNDVGLETEEDGIPMWLGDEDMCAGIRNRIEAERCIEEGDRLKREVLSLQSWCREEHLMYEIAVRLK